MCHYRPFALADASVRWTAGRFTLYGDVNNLLGNRNYVDYGNVPQPGRWMVCGVKYKL